MGTLKDLVDLVTQLSNSIEDRKTAAELREIQSMIGSIQSEHAELHDDRIRLMTENAQLKQEIADLKLQIIELKKPSDEQIDDLPDEAEKILSFIVEHEDVEAEQIAYGVKLSQARVDYWLGDLQNKELIYCSFSFYDPTTYSLLQDGRSYLMKKGLI